MTNVVIEIHNEVSDSKATLIHSRMDKHPPFLIFISIQTFFILSLMSKTLRKKRKRRHLKTIFINKHSLSGASGASEDLMRPLLWFLCGSTPHKLFGR